MWKLAEMRKKWNSRKWRKKLLKPGCSTFIEKKSFVVIGWSLKWAIRRHFAAECFECQHFNHNGPKSGCLCLASCWRYFRNEIKCINRAQAPIGCLELRFAIQLRKFSCSHVTGCSLNWCRLRRKNVQSDFRERNFLTENLFVSCQFDRHESCHFSKTNLNLEIRLAMNLINTVGCDSFRTIFVVAWLIESARKSIADKFDNLGRAGNYQKKCLAVFCCCHVLCWFPSQTCSDANNFFVFFHCFWRGSHETFIVFRWIRSFTWNNCQFCWLRFHLHVFISESHKTLLLSLENSLRIKWKWNH